MLSDSLSRPDLSLSSDQDKVVEGSKVKVGPPLTGKGTEEIKNINYFTSRIGSLSNPSQSLPPSVAACCYLQDLTRIITSEDWIF